MKALVYQGKIVQVAAQEFEVHPDYSWHDCPDACTTEWSFNDGVFEAPVPVVPTTEELLKEYKDAIRVFLDKKAQEKDYDSALSIASYATSTNVDWKAQADAFIAWRDLVFVEALQILADVQQGGEAPTIEALLAGLPALVWP